MSIRRAALLLVMVIPSRVFATESRLPVCKGNENDPKKLDVVFVPMFFYNLREFERAAEEHIDFNARHRGILSFEPFKSNRHKFKFWKAPRVPARVRDPFEEKMCHTYDGIAQAPRPCVNLIKNWLAEIGCGYDKAVIMIKNDVRGLAGAWAEDIGGTVAATIDRYNPPLDKIGGVVTVHEFAHLLGLVDEVEKPYVAHPWRVNAVPNCDQAGCAKWCKDYVREPFSPKYFHCRNRDRAACSLEAGCVWREMVDPYYKTRCVPFNDHVNIGRNCLPGTGCYHNCNGVGAWRPADYSTSGQPTSLMFYPYKATGFDAVDRRFLEQVLAKYQ